MFAEFNQKCSEILAKCIGSREGGRGEAEGKVPSGDGRLRATGWALSVPPEALAEEPEVLRLRRLPNGKTKARRWWWLGQTDLRQQSYDGRGHSDSRVRSYSKDVNHPALQQVRANELIHLAFSPSHH